jgi:hypothetical protein
MVVIESATLHDAMKVAISCVSAVTLAGTRLLRY